MLRPIAIEESFSVAGRGCGRRDGRWRSNRKRGRRWRWRGGVDGRSPVKVPCFTLNIHSSQVKLDVWGFVTPSCSRSPIGPMDGGGIYRQADNHPMRTMLCLAVLHSVRWAPEPWFQRAGSLNVSQEAQLQLDPLMRWTLIHVNVFFANITENTIVSWPSWTTLPRIQYATCKLQFVWVSRHIYYQ